MKDPDTNWIPQLAHAAVSRAQTKCNKDDIKPLMVSQSDIPSVTVQELNQAQKKDVSLQRLWKEVQDSSDHQT